MIFTLQNNSRENNFRLQSWNAIIFDIDDPLSKNHREIINLKNFTLESYALKIILEDIKVIFSNYDLRLSN